MNQNTGGANPFDPFSAWRQFQDSQMETWSKAMIEAVNSEAYAEATGRMLDAYLSISAPFRQVMEGTMTQTLTQLNMPTREDVTSLAQRLTNIEMRLDDLDARFDDLMARLPATPPASAPESGAPNEQS